MCSKSLQNFEQTFTKSTIFKTLAYFLMFLSLCPQNSSQQVATDKFSTIEVTCVYNYLQDIYTCNIHNATVLNPTDVLEIIGTHLVDYTDVDVQAVNYVDSVIRYFNGEVFRKFENLKHLYLVGQDLMEIGANAFDVCTNLEQLVTGLDELAELPPKMLGNCGNLKIFIAILHKLTEIPENLFGETTNLEEFYVTSNKLTSLPEKLLQNMKNLRIFNAADNLLKDLSPNFFINAVNLEEFSLSNNLFEDHQIIVNVLNGRTNLKTLFLDKNMFTNFDFGFFAQFTKLEELTIGSTLGPKLTEISWQSLPSSLIYLTVDGVGEEIPGNSFDRLVNLEKLTLSGSGIENLHKDTFNALSTLKELSIQNTNIKTFHPELFTNQINLSNLNLDNNEIEELPAGIFTPLVNIGIKNDLQGIRLASNNIQRLNANSFGYHPHLRYIIFNRNKINEIERGIFSKFNSKMETANFVANVCIDRLFRSVTNLDEDERMTLCFNNWAGITTPIPTTTSTEAAPTTTPGGCGRNFNKLEIFVIIFVGFVKSLVSKM